MHSEIGIGDSLFHSVKGARREWEGSTGSTEGVDKEQRRGNGNFKIEGAIVSGESGSGSSFYITGCWLIYGSKSYQLYLRYIA